MIEFTDALLALTSARFAGKWNGALVGMSALPAVTGLNANIAQLLLGAGTSAIGHWVGAAR